MISLPGSHTLKFLLTKEWKAFSLFFCGFLFDIFTLDRVDDTLTLIQQLVFLFCATLILGIKLIEHDTQNKITAKYEKIWKYNDEGFHFIIGSLLSGYTLFYLKSASTFGSLVFILIMGGLLAINELPSFQRLQMPFKVGLLAWSWISYLLLVIPTLFGSLGLLPKLVAGLLFLALCASLYFILLKKNCSNKFIKTHLIIPSALCGFVFFQLLLYKILPPVPLSLQYIGIYRSIEKKDGNYLAAYNRPIWRIWENGEQTLSITSDQKVYTFVKVFSPTDFKENLVLEYYYKSPKSGWTQQDSIKLGISGGRKEGFRGYTYKGIHSAGDWQAVVLTSDGGELGRISFSIDYDNYTDNPRVDTF